MRKLKQYTAALLATAMLVTSGAAAETVRYPFDHNGSLMSLVEDGANMLFVYDNPRPAIAHQGVRPGEVLLVATRHSNGTIDGVASVFRLGCLPIYYDVRVVSETPEGFLFEGPAPVLSHTGCLVVGWTMQSANAHLYFQALPLE